MFMLVFVAVGLAGVGQRVELVPTVIVRVLYVVKQTTGACKTREQRRQRQTDDYDDVTAPSESY